MSSKYDASIREQEKEAYRNIAKQYKRERRDTHQFRAPIRREKKFRKYPIPKSYVDHPVYGRLRY